MKLTRGHRVLATLVALLLVGTIGPWLIWGEAFERSFSLAGTLTWLRELGPWAAAAGVSLLVADIALPIPSTIVMSALGATYGFWVGGLLFEHIDFKDELWLVDYVTNIGECGAKFTYL